ncbi:MAG TPA: hypothetical protein VGH28_20565 [Polyangiaceae bacterium]|jgi:hypothetical protein
MGLSVIVDGVRMKDDEARAFWARFSDHMEKNKGDLGGFAKAEGFASVRPTMTASGPELVVSRTAAQQPYTKAGSSAGSPKPQEKPAAGQKSRGKPRRS